MNLDQQDLELIRATVQAAVSTAMMQATRELASKQELREFRDEVRGDRDRSYDRAMIDQFFREASDDRDRLWQEVKSNQNVVNKLWENAAIKAGAVFAVVLQAIELWRIFGK